MFSIENIVKICCDLKITLEQFFILYLTYKGNRDPSIFKNLYKYNNEIGKFEDKVIDDLINRGFIEDKNTSKVEIFPDLLIVKEKFYNKLFIAVGDHVEELWEEFPHFITSEGKNFPAKTISQEELEPLYRKAIGNKIEEHSRVMESLRRQIAAGSVPCGLEKWVKGQFWKTDSPNAKSVSLTRDI